VNNAPRSSASAWKAWGDSSCGGRPAGYAIANLLLATFAYRAGAAFAPATSRNTRRLGALRLGSGRRQPGADAIHHAMTPRRGSMDGLSSHRRGVRVTLFAQITAGGATVNLTQPQRDPA